MKKLFSIFVIAGIISFFNANASTSSSMAAISATMLQEEDVQESDTAPAEESLTFHQELKKRFIEGGAGFMGIVLLCLILSLIHI